LNVGTMMERKGTVRRATAAFLDSDVIGSIWLSDGSGLSE
jgi:hypothetical protein